MNRHEQLPGTVPASGPDPTLEWVRPDVGLLGAIDARLGSDPRGEELLVAVMRALRGPLPSDTWEAILDELPFSARALLRADTAMGRAGRREGDPLEAIAGAMMHPLPRTRLEVRAVLASLKQALPRGLVDAIGTELTGELALLWRDAG